MGILLENTRPALSDLNRRRDEAGEKGEAAQVRRRSRAHLLLIMFTDVV